MTKIFTPLFALFLLVSCNEQATDEAASGDASAASPTQEFMASIAEHCGQSYAGQMVSDDEADADMAGEAMVMHVAECGEGEIRIPFHVGDDHSRTWVLTVTEEGLRLKHDHRHEDGSEDAVTQYGGDTADGGTANRQVFPVDAESIALFSREGLDVSVINVWAMEIDDTMFAYELRRDAEDNQRFFRVEFDLTEPVPTPPPAWGSEGNGA